MGSASYAKGCRAGWFRQSGGIPEVVGSIPGRGEFPPPIKKPPRLPHVQSIVESDLTHKSTGPVYECRSVRRSFYLSNNAVGAVLPAGKLFLGSASYERAGPDGESNHADIATTMPAGEVGGAPHRSVGRSVGRVNKDLN